MTDKKLIDKLIKLYNCKSLKAFAELHSIEYPTIAKWHSKDEIPTYKSYGKLYLLSLLELAETKKELNLYKDIDKSKKALKDYQDDK